MVKTQIDDNIKDKSFILFTKPNCIFCDQFKYMINALHTSFEVIDLTFYILNVKVDENRELKNTLINEVGVPYSILINGDETRTIKGLKTVLEIVGVIDELFG